MRSNQIYVTRTYLPLSVQETSVHCPFELSYSLLGSGLCWETQQLLKLTDWCYHCYHFQVDSRNTKSLIIHHWKTKTRNKWKILTKTLWLPHNNLPNSSEFNIFRFYRFPLASQVITTYPRWHLTHFLDICLWKDEKNYEKIQQKVKCFTVAKYLAMFSVAHNFFVNLMIMGKFWSSFFFI